MDIGRWLGVAVAATMLLAAPALVLYIAYENRKTRKKEET